MLGVYASLACPLVLLRVTERRGGREGGREGAGHLIHKPVLISGHVYCTVMEHSTYTAFVPGAKIFPQEEGMGGGTKS